MKPDHGLGLDDLEIFQSQLIAEAMELAWQCANLPEGWDKTLLKKEIVETLSQAYQIAMWADAVLENPRADFDSPKPVEHQLYVVRK